MSLSSARFSPHQNCRHQIIIRSQNNKTNFSTLSENSKPHITITHTSRDFPILTLFVYDCDNGVIVLCLRGQPIIMMFSYYCHNNGMLLLAPHCPTTNDHDSHSEGKFTNKTLLCKKLHYTTWIAYTCFSSAFSYKTMVDKNSTENSVLDKTFSGFLLSSCLFIRWIELNVIQVFKKVFLPRFHTGHNFILHHHVN